MPRYVMYHQRRVISDEEAKQLVAYADDDWVEYQVAPDNNGMGVHQWIHDLRYEDHPDLYAKVWNVMADVNDDIWQFAITDWQQPLRVVKYTPGLSHDWHVDYTPEDRSKLALSVPLDGEYTGGALQILEAGTVPLTPPGVGTFFPAYHGHRVTPVLSGVRYALLGWFTGPRFR